MLEEKVTQIMQKESRQLMPGRWQTIRSLVPEQAVSLIWAGTICKALFVFLICSPSSHGLESFQVYNGCSDRSLALSLSTSPKSLCRSALVQVWHAQGLFHTA